ncbi:MAG TPA: hypothetical protein VKR31_10090 [Rhizomicrobium sp.]|nr:hypothetical protein [Rhizomicrobium sp.]
MNFRVTYKNQFGQVLGRGPTINASSWEECYQELAETPTPAPIPEGTATVEISELVP